MIWAWDWGLGTGDWGLGTGDWKVEFISQLITQHGLNAPLPLTALITHYSALSTQHSALLTQHSTAIV
ncbi:hypothetical protein [Nostoc sp. CMAA1605]|uniref:hypothetical protein n=1 Tax=Nostoc sp. CMAA1605 TaxID=2055159 RepID=UPI001F261F6B|nr:hypothetical protein [Nostoc sp. CMAA1605]MCF4970148.1 hypothetical protein [Nostoc sp. CMAA1605]